MSDNTMNIIKIALAYAQVIGLVVISTYMCWYVIIRAIKHALKK